MWEAEASRGAPGPAAPSGSWLEASPTSAGGQWAAPLAVAPTLGSSWALQQIAGVAGEVDDVIQVELTAICVPVGRIPRVAAGDGCGGRKVGVTIKANAPHPHQEPLDMHTWGGIHVWAKGLTADQMCYRLYLCLERIFGRKSHWLNTQILTVIVTEEKTLGKGAFFIIIISHIMTEHQVISQ